MIRRAFIIFGLWLLLIGGGAWTFAPREVTQLPMTAVVPPPIRTDWEEFPVGGLLLVNPRDSTFTVIPQGAMLQIPYLVKGPGPDDL